MTTNSESSTPLTTSKNVTSETGSETKQATRDEADRLKHHAQSAASDLSHTAKHEAQSVQDEAMAQAKSLASTVQDEIATQASTQQQRLAEQSRTVTDDLQRIRRGESPQSDMVRDVVANLADRAENFTRTLETKEPGELLADVRGFAARRPGTFLLLAAGAGLLAGRLTRGLRDANTETSSRDDQTSPGAPPRRDTTPVRGAETLGGQPDMPSGGRHDIP